jgi:hypothetical protein
MRAFNDQGSLFLSYHLWPLHLIPTNDVPSGSGSGGRTTNIRWRSKLNMLLRK